MELKGKIEPIYKTKSKKNHLLFKFAAENGIKPTMIIPDVQENVDIEKIREFITYSIKNKVLTHNGSTIYDLIAVHFVTDAEINQDEFISTEYAGVDYLIDLTKTLKGDFFGDRYAKTLINEDQKLKESKYYEWYKNIVKEN